MEAFHIFHQPENMWWRSYLYLMLLVKPPLNPIFVGTIPWSFKSQALAPRISHQMFDLRD